jgi:hypothetical protein
MSDETIEDSIGTRQRDALRRRSRTYGSPGVGTIDNHAGQTPAAPAALPEQGDFMRAEPYVTTGSGGDTTMDGQTASTAVAQRGRHGEGAETTGNSVRGALSAGLSGATTTRGGQQGGIGASAYDPEPTAVDGGLLADSEAVPERDLTLGDAYGGAMEQPGDV